MKLVKKILPENKPVLGTKYYKPNGMGEIETLHRKISIAINQAALKK